MKNRKFLFISLFAVIAFLISFGCNKAKIDWEKTEQVNTIEAYNEFISKHPHGHFSQLAKQRIKELEWNKAIKTNTIEAYEYFMSKHPKSKYYDQAMQNIQHLEKEKVTRLIDLIIAIQLGSLPGASLSQRLKEMVQTSDVHLEPTLLFATGDDFKYWPRSSPDGVRLSLREDKWNRLAFISIGQGSDKLPSVEFKKGEIGIINDKIFVKEGTQAKIDNRIYSYVKGGWQENKID